VHEYIGRQEIDHGFSLAYRQLLHSLAKRDDKALEEMVEPGLLHKIHAGFKQLDDHQLSLQLLNLRENPRSIKLTN